jgi:formate hydrogenlyase subunit 4
VIAATYRGETQDNLITDEKKKHVERVETPIRVISIAVMLLLGLFFSRTKDYEALGFGAMPYFWLTTSSYYYYILRMTLVVVHARDLSKTRNVVGLAMLFAMELFCNASEHINPGNRYLLIGWLSVMLTIYSATMLLFLYREWRSSKE